MDSPLIEHKFTEPTTPKQYYLWRNRDISMADGPLTNWAQLYRALLHQNSMTHGEIETHPGQMDSPTANQTQVYRALLHQDSISYWEIMTNPGQMNPPLIEPKCTEPYYTRTVLAIEKSWHTQGRWNPMLNEHKFTEPYCTNTVLAMEKSRHTRGRWTPTNQLQVYRALLHQNSITYGEIETHSGQMNPPLLIKPKCTEPYYTRTVLAIEKSWHTQGRWTPC